MKRSEHLTWGHDPEANLTILLAIYSSMTSLAQELRGTAERLTLGGVALPLVFDGWLLAREPPAGESERIFASIAILIFGILLMLVVRTLHVRYRSVAYVIRRINEVQMAHDADAFIQHEALFPAGWRDFGTNTWNEPIFRLSYVSVALVVTFAAGAVWGF